MMAKPSTTYKDKLNALRAIMKDQDVAAYIVPRADEFQGEFVAPYAERLKWLTGFTGSGGMALVFAEKAIVLTDGRYMLQVEQQVDNALFETGDYTKKPTAKWLADNLGQGDVIGYDPFMFTSLQIEVMNKEVAKKGVNLKPISGNLVDKIWEDQPERPAGQVSLFPDGIAGKTAKSKMLELATTIKENNAHACIIALPDSIAWLLNVRGADIDYIPYVLSYVIMHEDGALTWLINPDKVSNEIREHIGGQVSIHDINDLQGVLTSLSKEASGKSILIDEGTVPIVFKAMLECHGANISPLKDLTIAPKSRKTSTEIAAIKAAHIQDGLALVKFLKYIEDESPSGKLSEVGITEALEAFRAQSSSFKGNSFPTIAGYASNGAVIHYRADDDTNKTINGDNLLLVDSGGQYADQHTFGTTDITRTIPIGKPNKEMQESFTRVLKGHIALAQAKFPHGTIGAQVDILARKPLWDVGLDYAHGTGHGVGCYLAVHEDAANISSRGQTAFEVGMLISNEPGYYKAGDYGIRIENLVLVQEDENMLSFETISLAPIDLSLVVNDMLSEEEMDWLNTYHASVHKKLSPLLDVDHKEWLEAKTQPIT